MSPTQAALPPLALVLITLAGLGTPVIAQASPASDARSALKQARTATKLAERALRKTMVLERRPARAGAAGPSGPAGPAGATGSAGPPGAEGATGLAGAGGVEGKPGADGVPGPTYTAGSGLLLTGSAFAVDPTFVQRRVTTACAAGSAIRALAQDGVPTCQTSGAGDITSVTAGSGLAGGGTTGDVSLAVKVPLALTGATTTPGVLEVTQSSVATVPPPAIVGTSTASPSGTGVRGIAATGVEGVSTNSITASQGVLGRGTIGVRGNATESGGGIGVYGVAENPAAIAGGFAGRVRIDDATGDPDGGALVVGNDAVNGVAIKAVGRRHGVSALGNSPSTAALYARNEGGTLGAQVDDNLVVNGSATVNGTLAKSAGTFKIDHPLDPANRYLQHSFVESPEMLNLYTGVTRTDGEGRARVPMPAWFDALNRTFTYQLTPTGSPARAWIDKELRDNVFEIRSERPGVKVSWMVTGVREDVYAERNRVQVEVDKAPQDLGRYLYPQGFGKPASLRIGAGR